MRLSYHEVEILLEEVENVGLTPYKGTYNGRFNAVCKHAFSGSKDQYKLLLSNIITTAVNVAIDNEIGMADGYKNIAEWLINARTDNFGKEYIWY